jgi:hypothetical protein
MCKGMSHFSLNPALQYVDVAIMLLTRSVEAELPVPKSHVPMPLECLHFVLILRHTLPHFHLDARKP